MRELARRIGEGRVWQYSVFVAYYTAVTLFPLVVGVFNVLNYFGLSPEPLIQGITRVVPGPFASWLAEDLHQIYETSHVAILIIAAVTSIWTISWAMAALQMGLNGAYGVQHRKNLVVLRLIAFLLTFVFAGVGVPLLLAVREAGVLLLYVPAVGLLIGMLYYLLPNVRQKWTDVIPGTVFSTIIVFIAATVYTLFLQYIPEASTFFTTLGAFTFVMVLLQLVNMMILIGGVLNAVLQRRKYGEVTEKNEESKFLRAWDKIKKSEE